MVGVRESMVPLLRCTIFLLICSQMWQLRYWIYLLLIALSVAPVQRVTACSCIRNHPQELFCNSDYVALVRVKKATNVNEYQIGYSVKINKIFRVNSRSSYAALKKNILWTASSESVCGVDLKVGETYVVGGNTHGDNAHVSICGITMPWRSVTSRQRKGFRHLYRFGCMKCGIHYTPWRSKGAALEHTDGKKCLWESRPGPEDCQRDYGICMPGQGGVCSWVPSVPYKNCIKEHKQAREQQRAREP
ncbi:metalloproteinase inhibitor 1 [Ceratina calcarata]|uniref:Metalloproteinase inhibitor 1 n=1 Tax=Ceratina calcarata TaxID=156304 RepID=A0AAJ7J9D1_9HYME|nr:metalloproteinase inhibitor 1 [Ceratina calcarata]